LIYFWGNNPVYTFSLKPIYEQMKAENYAVQWGGVTEVYGRDFKIVCNLSDLNTNTMTLLTEVNEELSKKIKRKLEQFIYKPSDQATKRAVKVIKELIEE